MYLTVRAALIVHLKSYKILKDEPHCATGHRREYELRIATWNIERLKHKNSLEQILLACEQIQADILVLTETDHRVCPDYQYSFHTPPPRTRSLFTQTANVSGGIRPVTSILRCASNWKQKKLLSGHKGIAVCFS